MSKEGLQIVSIKQLERAQKFVAKAAEALGQLNDALAEIAGAKEAAPKKPRKKRAKKESEPEFKKEFKGEWKEDEPKEKAAAKKGNGAAPTKVPLKRGGFAPAMPGAN